MEAEFSKKMFERLKEYEAYVEECKSPMLQKDMVVVDRNELMALIRELKVFHGVDHRLEDEDFVLDPETLQMTKEQLLKNAMWQARQMVTEAEVVRTSTLEDARKEGEQILAEVREEAEALRKRLDEEIESYRKEKEAELKASMDEAKANAMNLLEQETDQAYEIYSDTVYKAEEMVNLMSALYEQQIEIIARDRQDIIDIVEKLERRGAQK